VKSETESRINNIIKCIGELAKVESEFSKMIEVIVKGAV
jgi:hypothetical protein